MPVYVEKGGLERVIRANGRATGKMTRTIKDVLEQCAHMVLKRSQKYVPVDTERLKKSGKVVTEDTQGLGALSAVVYEAPYAIYVHERVDIPHAPPTQAKYVERAVRELRGSMTALVKRQVRVGGN